MLIWGLKVSLVCMNYKARPSSENKGGERQKEKSIHGCSLLIKLYSNFQAWDLRPFPLWHHSTFQHHFPHVFDQPTKTTMFPNYINQHLHVAICMILCITK